ncbi:anti-repressor SinI family protein [Neobacillus sp. DY30]|nr:anti-repressor SinI family protein [Neobacillus sp. DY30]WHY00326.1 anti-repressor SinI family protein [Neobacillus sp. DY30]
MTITLDKEWVALIKKALELGISVEEIRDFLRNNQVSE